MLGVFIAEIDAAAEGAGIAGGAEAVDLVGAAFGFLLGEELGKGDGVWWVRGSWFVVSCWWFVLDRLCEKKKFGGGDEEVVAVLFELAAAAAGLADGLARGDVGVGCGEDEADFVD